MGRIGKKWKIVFRQEIIFKYVPMLRNFSIRSKNCIQRKKSLPKQIYKRKSNQKWKKNKKKKKKSIIHEIGRAVCTVSLHSFQLTICQITLKKVNLCLNKIMMKRRVIRLLSFLAKIFLKKNPKRYQIKIQMILFINIIIKKLLN